MNKTITLNPVTLQLLQLFAEAGTGSGTAGNGTMGATATAAMSQMGVDANNGNQPSPQATDDNNAQDLDSRFAEMIKGEFKEQYNKSVESVVKNRLKNSKETTDKFNKLQPALAKIAQNYNVDPTDIDSLVAAVENDNKYYEKEALEAGVDVEFYKRLKTAEDKNRAYDAQEQMRQDIAKWYNDFETNVKPVYQNVDFDAAMNNPDFVRLMRNGIDALSAFTAINARNAIPAAMEAAARQATKQVVDDIAANGSRPLEGAAMGSSAVVTKSDVSSLTDAQISEIAERVKRGERGIDFINKF